MYNANKRSLTVNLKDERTITSCQFGLTDSEFTRLGYHLSRRSG